MEEVFEATRLACIDKRIDLLPYGYHTIIGGRGIELSDGEKQRIALARCFLINPKIWLLDEATANLDAKTESIIIKNLAKRSTNNTIIMVSHRKNIKEFADVVIDVT